MIPLPEGAQRLMTHIVRSAPSQQRPRLPDEYEAMLHSSDVERAACYASMEDLSDRLDRVARAISEDMISVPIHINEDEEDSLVVRVGEAMGAT